MFALLDTVYNAPAFLHSLKYFIAYFIHPTELFILLTVYMCRVVQKSGTPRFIFAITRWGNYRIKVR